MTAGPGEKRAGLVVVFHPFEAGAQESGDILASASQLLARAGIPVMVVPSPVHDADGAREAAALLEQARIDVLVVRLATWTDDTVLLDMVDVIDVPVITWAHRDIDAGSLCGAQQFNMVLRELGKASHVVIGTGAAAASKIRDIFLATSPRPGPAEYTLPDDLARVSRDLRRLRVGIIGARTQGMMEVAFDEFSIKEILGPMVFSLPVRFIEDEAGKLDAKVVDGAIHAFTRQHPDVTVGIEPGEMRAAFRFHLALERVARSRGLGAVTIECYPRDMGKACISFSLLSDAGIACACEGDVHAAILAWIMQRLSAAPINHVDLLDIDEDAGTVAGGHCGACSLSLAAPSPPPRVVPARLAGTGACIPFTGKAGAVTMANLVGRKGTYRAMIVGGTAIDTHVSFPGATITIRLDASLQAFLDTIEREGMGHHWIVACGRCEEPLAAVLASRGVRVVRHHHQG